MSLKYVSRSAGGSRRQNPTKIPQRNLVASAVASCLMLGTPVALGQVLQEPHKSCIIFSSENKTPKFLCISPADLSRADFFRHLSWLLELRHFD